MEFQGHLLKNVFKGDKERFAVAWQQALDEGCEEAVSWKNLTASEPKSDRENPVDLNAIQRFEGLDYVLSTLHFEQFKSYFIWKH